MLATRRALSEAAVVLAAERGLDNVLVADIAKAVGVSARTFNNYFGSKQEAIVGVMAGWSAALGEEISARPSEEPVWDAIANGVATCVPHPVPKKFRDYAHLVRSTPALEAEQLRAHAVMERFLTVEIATRTGLDPSKDLFPGLAACSVIGAMRAALHYWLDAAEDISYSELLQRVIRQIGSALSVPDIRTLR